jgi:hypothetical protein
VLVDSTKEIAMYPNLLNDADFKIVYDNQGNKREVLLDYAKFQELMDFVERYAYFYSQQVQERIAQSDADLKSGRSKEFAADEIDQALDWLNE